MVAARIDITGMTLDLSAQRKAGLFEGAQAMASTLVPGELCALDALATTPHGIASRVLARPGGGNITLREATRQ
jgi:hypothetical protein